MLTYFSRYFSTRAIVCYLVTLILVSTFFISHAMPFQFMLFGLVPVLLFFTYSNKLTMNWQHFSERIFTRKLFVTALLIRIIYVVFIYFYYIEMTGLPHMYHAGDEVVYEYMGTLLREEGFARFRELLTVYHFGFSDSGYCWWLAIENALLGTHPLSYRMVKCIIDAFACVLMYNLARRNFGEAAGRITGIFCMLMPNMWYYCGLTLKETEMAFMTILFVERADMALRAPKIKFQNILLPGLIILAMFTFRTALAAVLAAALVAALILSSGKQFQTWKKILYCSVFAIWMLMTVGAEMIEEMINPKKNKKNCVRVIKVKLQNKDNKNQDKNQNEKDKQQKQDQQKDKQKQQKEQSQKEQMSKDNAEQLLNAALQAERATQQKLKKAMAQPNRRNLDKNW